ncbi:MAG: hypothetical protein ACXIT4_13400 [Erythrobacter sp.]
MNIYTMNDYRKAANDAADANPAKATKAAKAMKLKAALQAQAANAAVAKANAKTTETDPARAARTGAEKPKERVKRKPGWHKQLKAEREARARAEADAMANASADAGGGTVVIKAAGNITLDHPGPCAVEAMQTALLRLMGMPRTADGTDDLWPREPIPLVLRRDTGSPELGGEEDYAGLVALARCAQVKQADFLIIFANDAGNQTGRYFGLLRPGRFAPTITLVEPCRVRASKPLMLVSEDRTQAFMLDYTRNPAGALISMPLPRAKGIGNRIGKAWRQIAAEMSQITIDPAKWANEATFAVAMPDQA